ncbi:hypothetical protein F2P81_005728 [Scophthalmus maximus]|uniref:Uncharacterized protein n=1 Tax=Scophthalmus maximus TaxID=52904 RepID=A0A6A4T3W1_SCOMX|nr:hypothetical protein F2P81_005728 [Scophthalmus maximus]
MNWTQARQHCKTNYTDMVVIQSQEENDYLVSLLPNRKGSPYYWIGITRNHKNETWTWLGNNSTWIGNESWAENEPNNNHSTEFCVEIYVKTGNNRGRWNDEKCSNKKYPVCYKGYKHALLAVAGCGALSALCCICFCWMKRRKRKKLTQMSQESVDTQQSLHHRVLIVALIVFTQDLSSSGGAQAWTYNYSITPNRRWPQARQWCQQHFTDMVAVQNQEETDFINNLLPFNPKYYWIGVRKVDGVWTREGNSKVVPEDARNWAPEEPDDIAGQDCVEIYIKRERDTAMWNNEKCHAKKGTVCYTAIACKPLSDPEQGSHYCFHPYGFSRFNSSCRFHCELGFRLVGMPQLLCQTGGRWNHHVPLCQVEQCPVLNHTNSSGGRMNCSHPIAPDSYNSTLKKCGPIFFPAAGNVTCVDTVEPFSFGSQCNYACQEGYDLSGDDTLACLASGQWSKPTPTCAAKRCNPQKPPSHGSLSCSDPNGEFSFGSRCTSTCDEGFLLNGTARAECTSLGAWNADIPRCMAERCPTLSPPNYGDLFCSDPYGEFSFGSRCTSTCEEGFVLNGMADTECTSVGTWSRDIPQCLEDMPVGAPMLMYSGAGAASVVVPLVLIGLALLILTRSKRRGIAIISDMPSWEERENPAFEF